MFTFKNLVAVGFFLFGSTFLWMTRSFLAEPKAGTGTIWSAVQVLVFMAIIGFSLVAWAVFKDANWWEPVALVSAIVGLIAVVPYVVGIFQVGDQGDSGVQMNIAIHVIGAAAVIAVVAVPFLHDWITKRT